MYWRSNYFESLYHFCTKTAECLLPIRLITTSKFVSTVILHTKAIKEEGGNKANGTTYCPRRTWTGFTWFQVLLPKLSTLSQMTPIEIWLSLFRKCHGYFVGWCLQHFGVVKFLFPLLPLSFTFVFVFIFFSPKKVTITLPETIYYFSLLSWTSNNQVSFWSLAAKITCKKDIEDINR